MFKKLTLAILMVSSACYADMPTIFRTDESALSFYGVTNKINKMKLSQINNKEKKNTVLMLGDSITQGLNNNDLHFESVNLGIGGDTVHGLKARIKDIDTENWKSVFIEIGTNNILMGENGIQLGEEISELIDYASKNSKQLFVSEVFIPNRSVVNGISEDASQANAILYKKCSEFNNCKIIKIPESMLISGSLTSKYTIYDGIHLNGDAYSKWKVEINKSLAEFPYSLYYKYMK
ncbi:SGNH/GDSL hydrolase family protein [Enterobacter asburiae]|uniref:SGNH/GDSL hydrolase family protein n=1 Tax=Enterobacter asburiae TaxID=61645 RepID=UPI00192AE46E|nr:GDSL-type esterase/lipase family protein [Enterobacter asburiae]MBL5913933.1 hypothetical protein [Enterobacter asburiae]